MILISKNRLLCNHKLNSLLLFSIGHAYIQTHACSSMLFYNNTIYTRAIQHANTNTSINLTYNGDFEEFASEADSPFGSDC